MAQHHLTPATYRTLVSKISKELTELETLIRNRTGQTYWQIGKHIDDHLLQHKHRANYGLKICERLAPDVGSHASTLHRALKFYRAYPILAQRPQLSWTHYKSLITINDERERKKVEQQIIDHDWNVTRLRDYLSTKRELSDPNGPVARLKFTRGRLHTYQIVKANRPLAKISPLVLDMGFRLQYIVPGTARVKEGDCVEVKGKGIVQKVEISKDELFTYQAQIDKIVDGDTLLVSFDFNSDVSISQKLRLRGIDCPEMDTEEGKKAKRFVEARLKDCDFIIVKTYKDRSDKFDRYLADIFYADGAADPSLVAREGKYLNQELLDERLAVKYEI